MSGAKKAAGGCVRIVALLIGAIVVWFWVSFPTASYRYRLTISVESEGQIHTGSSVIEVDYRFNPQWSYGMLPMYNITVKGQAAVVDLGARGVLVAALGNNRDQSTVEASFLAGRALQPSARQRGGWYGATLDRVRELSRMSQAAVLTADNMPPFIWFSDKSDPNSGRAVKPEEFGAVIGDLVHLASAQVEVTQAPIVIDLDKRLPLYNRLPQHRNSD